MRTATLWGAGLLCVVSMGCGRPLEVAVGSNQEATIFTEWSREDDRVQWVKELLETEVITAIPSRPEKSFKVTISTPEGLDSRENWRVHVLLADLTEFDGTVQIIRDILDDQTIQAMASKPADRRVLKDVFARGQTVLVLHCADPRAFRSYIQVDREKILDLMEETLLEGLVKTLFIAEEQKELQDQIHSDFGFSIRIPGGFNAEQDSANQVQRIYGKKDQGQSQYVIVHSRPREEGSLDPKWALHFRDQLVVRYNRGDHVDFENSRGELGTFQGQEALLLKGLWQNEEYTGGGAFESFLFFREDRFFIIDIAVFYPEGGKLPYLRELRAVAKTFRFGGNGEAVSS